ncbi:protein unc-50 homolog isoform X1 [Mangifera indica]|uniref:protein unc-50 homolog isoform X1 n=1 Tax=Mangifera indica TaxID=29780 RepID=UPI001CFC0D2F|nr:protein unc-50 homolog isoform X1 [Mangifera indica]
MLPTSVSKERSSSAMSRSNSMLPQYLRRIIKWQQMDIEYTFWQMLHLCTSPKVVIGVLILMVSNALIIVILHFACGMVWSLQLSAYQVSQTYDHSATHAVFVVISVLLFHFLITGAVLATCCWFLTNAYLREESPNSHVVEQRVEWLYAFDVHCNAFFPLFVMLHVIHYFLSPPLVAYGFIPVLLSNLLFMVAACYYHYLNFLGYDVLPFLERTTFFLYPIGVVIVLCPILILSGFNPSRYFLNMYFSQRL